MHLAFSAFISAVCLIGFVHPNSLPYDLSERADVPTISIVGGTPAAAGEFRDIVVLDLGAPRSHCGGTLIASTAILTAAHCVPRFTNSTVNTFPVYLNTLSLNGGGTGSLTRRVSKLYIHPSYNAQTSNNDIAILILDSPVTTIPPVKLPSSQGATTTRPVATTRPITTTRPTACSCTCAPTRKPVVLRSERAGKSFSTYENQTAVVAGWGHTTSGGSSSNVLLKATVIIQPNTVCASQYSNFVAANMLCASAPGKDTCQNDSGGPIYVNGIQVGITSFGRGCALPNFAGVYTRVSTYIDWINNHMV